MSDGTPTTTELRLPRAASAQFCYHVRLAAAYAVTGNMARSASESVLAWAMLATAWPEAEAAANAVSSELVSTEGAEVSPEHRDAARRHAHAVALDLEAHFTSTGQREEERLYATIAEQLDRTIGALE